MEAASQALGSRVEKRSDGSCVGETGTCPSGGNSRILSQATSRDMTIHVITAPVSMDRPRTALQDTATCSALSAWYWHGAGRSGAVRGRSDHVGNRCAFHNDEPDIGGSWVWCGHQWAIYGCAKSCQHVNHRKMDSKGRPAACRDGTLRRIAGYGAFVDTRLDMQCGRGCTCHVPIRTDRLWHAVLCQRMEVLGAGFGQELAQPGI